MSKFSLSVIIPILDEANNIEKLTKKLKKNLTSINFEIIFVDDNSLDSSKKILERLKKNINFLNQFLEIKEEI